MREQRQDLGDRSALRFAAQAQEAFRFLSDYGFRLIASEVTMLRYTSDRAFVNVYHGRSSCELGAEVGLLGPASEDPSGFPIGALIRLQNTEEGDRYRMPVGTTAREVRAGLRKVADQLIAYGERALGGDEQVFQQLEAQRLEWWAAYNAQSDYRRTAPKAADAFREGRYGEARQLYESIQASLSPAELKKLEYARKRT